MKKLYPPHLSQLVFLNLKGEIEKINGLDYDLYLWLIYETHKNYALNNKTTVEFEYSKVRSSIKSKPNTNSIQSSLKRIGELQLLSNYLNSYGNKEHIVMPQPFEIGIIISDNKKSYGFSVKTSEKFLKWFDNPKPKVEVNYSIIFNLKKMSKLLYLFLKDSLGIYESKNRNVDISKLRDMMNICNAKTSNSNFITQLKKSKEDINEHSDISINFDVVKKRNLKSGLSEIESIKFSIKKDEKKLLKKRANNSDQNNTVKDDELTNAESVELIYENYLNSRIKEEFESSNTDVKNIGAYKNGIRNKLINDGIEEEFEIVKILSVEKQKLLSAIIDNQPYMIVLKNIDNEAEVYYFNNEFLLVNSYDHSEETKSKSETLEVINNMMGNYYFDLLRCDYSDKYKVGRIESCQIAA